MKIHWPTAAVLIAAIIATVTVAIAGPLAGVDPAVVTSLVSTTGILGAVVAAAMRGLLDPKMLPLALMLPALSGCGMSALDAQADAALIAARTLHEADRVLTDTRGAELDAVVADAARACEDGCDEDERDEWRAALADAEERWQPILACRSPVASALNAWVSAIDLAAVASDGDLFISLVFDAARRMVETYPAFVRCIELNGGPQLPGLPLGHGVAEPHGDGG